MYETQIENGRSDLALLSDGSKSPTPRSPKNINSDISSKGTLGAGNPTKTLALSIKNNQDEPADLNEGLESLFADGHMRPNFDPIKKAVPAF